MAKVNSHKDLVVWQKAMDLAVAVYELTRTYPKHELYGLTSQLRRAAASVPANIAEGSARKTTKEYSHFLWIAKGSLMEAETFLHLSIRLGYASGDQVGPAQKLVVEISKMLTAICSKLDRS